MEVYSLTVLEARSRSSVDGAAAKVLAGGASSCGFGEGPGPRVFQLLVAAVLVGTARQSLALALCTSLLPPCARVGSPCPRPSHFDGI